MKSFWQLSEEIGAPMGGGALPGSPPMGGGMGSGPPMGGMGGMPMGGPPMGGGMGGPPMGGGAMGAGGAPATQLKTSSIWSVWQKLLNGEPINKDKDEEENKSTGQEKQDVLEQPPAEQQPSEPPQPQEPSPQIAP